MDFLKEAGTEDADVEGGNSSIQELIIDDSEIILADYLKAGYSFIHVRTEEDRRAQKLIRENIAIVMEDTINIQEYWEWTSTRGLEKYNSSTSADPGSANIIPIPDALDQMADSGQEGGLVCVFYNIRQFMEMPVIVQKFKDVADDSRLVGSTIFIVGPQFNYPPELENEITIWDLDLPTSDQFYSSYKELTSAYEQEIGSVSDDVLKNSAASAVGMTELQGENSISLSISKHKRIVPTIIQNEKENIVKKSDVLEFVTFNDGMDSVGGFDVFKDWISKRKNAYSQEAIDYGLKPPKGVLLVGIPGCLSGDTLIPINRGQRTGHRKHTIKSLYYRFNNLHQEGKDAGAITPTTREWDLAIPTKTLSYKEDEGYIGYNRIDGVVYSGMKVVYKVTTDHGFVIKTTNEHKFMTPEGFIKLQDLRVGDTLFSYKEGVLPDDNKVGRNKNIALVQINNVGNHPYARVRVVNGLTYSSHPLHRLVIEAYMNGMRLEYFLHALQGDITELAFLLPDLEVHHKDEDRMNNTYENLKAMSKAKHAALHWGRNGNLNRYQNGHRLQKIASIERIGEQPTYDIQMADPYNNFVANGLVVHNSGKSLVAKSLSTYLQLPLIRFDMGKVFRGLQGGSEGAVRNALKTIEAVAPNIVWIDEIEKATAGTQSSGKTDGGTTARVMGTVLSWMQENTKPVFICATANNPSSLPAELLRKGRFSEVWGVPEPNSKSRMDIWRIHINKVRPGLEVDYDRLVEESKNYVGAEIEAIIEEAMFDAFNDGQAELSTEHLSLALSRITPQFETSKDTLAPLRVWMQERVRYVEESDINNKSIFDMANSRKLNLKGA